VTQYIARADIAVSGKIITAGNTFTAKSEEVADYLVSGQVERVTTVSAESKPAQRVGKAKTRKRK